MSSPATCLGCGCSCDDIHLVVNDDRIVGAQNACAIGVAWFGDGRVPANVRRSGRESAVDDALDDAGALLSRAARPLVYLAPDISCEAQRAALAIADALRGTLDHVTSATAIASVLAAQERGRAGATLGEIRNRADVVVFWGVDPAVRYPRYLSRYAPEPMGLHVPAGRRSRTVVAVDIGESRGPADADVRIALSLVDEVATLTLTAALIGAGSGPGLDPAPNADRLNFEGCARDLADRLLSGRYVAIVADAEPDASAHRDPARAGALVALSQTLNGPTRCALSVLRGGGNRSGAETVATAQTGYPTSIDFSRGHPRYRPFDDAASRLKRGDFDAALVVGAAALIPPEIVAGIATLPHVIIGPHASGGVLTNGAVVIDTGIAGIHEAGTAIRMDDVPLPLRGWVHGPPAAVEVVRALLRRLGLRR
jgi:formylmethanofuran dehydrogenase subunit B